MSTMMFFFDMGCACIFKGRYFFRGCHIRSDRETMHVHPMSQLRPSGVSARSSGTGGEQPAVPQVPGAVPSTPELARKGAERAHGLRRLRGNGGRSESTEKPGSYRADGFFGGFDASDSPREAGPGDSNYELTFTLRGTPGDSDDDWEAATEEMSEAPSSDEIEAVELASDRSSAPESWHNRFLVAWGPLWIGGVLALIAVTIPDSSDTCSGGRSRRDDPRPAGPSPILVAGLSCTVALLVISVPLVLLAAGLTELVRDVRAPAR